MSALNLSLERVLWIAQQLIQLLDWFRKQAKVWSKALTFYRTVFKHVQRSQWKSIRIEVDSWPYSWIFHCKASTCRIGISNAEHTFCLRVMLVHRLRGGFDHKGCWTYPTSFQVLLSTDFTTAAYTRLVNVSQITMHGCSWVDFLECFTPARIDSIVMNLWIHKHNHLTLNQLYNRAMVPISELLLACGFSGDLVPHFLWVSCSLIIMSKKTPMPIREEGDVENL